MDLIEIRNKLNIGYHLTDLNLKVTYYSRVSTDHLEQKSSLINQNEHFEKYIKDNKNWIYVDGYVDDGITGTSDIKRNNFMQMIEDGKQNKFDLIITKEISRFSRNTLDSIKYTRELLNSGVGVLFVNDNINTILPDSELRLTIMASMAQDEIRRLSERVKFGMHRSQEKGRILGNDMLYGYKKNKQTGSLIIVEEEKKVINDIYRMYVFDDISINKISKILNEKGIYTRQNKKWTASAISRIIKNPKYKGYYCGKKVEVINYMNKKIKYFDSKDWIMYKDNKKIPLIINEDLWDLANKKISSKYYKKTKNIDSNIYNNLIYCEKHKKVFYKKYFRKNKKDITWICSEYINNGKSYCDSPNIRQKELDYIMNDIYININTDRIIKILLDIYGKNNDKKDKKILKEFELLKENYKNKKSKLIDLNLNNIIDLNTLKEKNNEINLKLLDIDNRIKSLQELNTFNIVKLNKKLKKLILDKDLKNKLLKKIIKEIYASKNDENDVCLRINLNINLNFKKKYFFKRGFDTKGTKRYMVKYIVQCCYSN